MVVVQDLVLGCRLGNPGHGEMRDEHPIAVRAAEAHHDVAAAAGRGPHHLAGPVFGDSLRSSLGSFWREADQVDPVR